MLLPLIFVRKKPTLQYNKDFPMQIFFLCFFPFIYQLSFWLFIFQAKEYRYDRLKEYIRSPLWQDAIFGKVFYLKMALLVLAICFDISTYCGTVLFWGLLLLNAFYFIQIAKRLIFFPKISTRSILTTIVSLILFWIIWEQFTIYQATFLILSLTFPWLYVAISSIILLPFINYRKHKTIYLATKASQENTNTMKIWVTWSYGKSSVKEYIAFLLEWKGKTLKTPADINTELWVSRFVLSHLDATFKYFVVEMWAYKPWEIRTLWKIINHKYGFLTAIWSQHLWLFWNIESLKAAKLEVAEKVQENGGILYVNWDNPEIRKIKFRDPLKVVRYGIKDDENINAISKIEGYEYKSMHFTFSYKGKDYKLKTNLLWEHGIINISWVLAFLVDIWVEIETIQDKLLSLPKPKHTLNMVEKEWYHLIDDTLNHSEEGLLTRLPTFKYFKKQRVLVVDDIPNVWGMGEEIHYEAGRKVAEMKVVDKVFYVWKRYKANFLYGLKSGWFLEKDYISSLSEINKEAVIMFEWSGSLKYFYKLAKH